MRDGYKTIEAPAAALRQRHRAWQWQLYSQVQAADAAARTGRTNGVLCDLPTSTRVVGCAAPGLFSSLGGPDHIGSLFSDSGLPAEQLDVHGPSGMKQSATAPMPTPRASPSGRFGEAADGLPVALMPPSRLVEDGRDAALVSTLSARPPPLPPQAPNTAVYGPLADTLSVRVPDMPTAPMTAASSPRPRAPTKLVPPHAIDEREPWRMPNDKPSRRGGVRAVLTPPRPSRKRIVAPPSAPLWHASGGVAAGQPCNDDANCTAAVLEPSVHVAAPQRQHLPELLATQPAASAPPKEWRGLGRRSSTETGPLLPHQVTTLCLS